MIGRAARRIRARSTRRDPGSASARGRPSGTGARRSGGRFITIGVQGLRVYGKANADRATLQGVATTLVKGLDV
jgi:hypothetical protein